MRFRVEIELADSEIPVATEILQVIRLLTEHVKGSQLVVNGVPSAAQPPAGQGLAPAALPAAPAAVAAAPPPVAASTASSAQLPLKELVRSILLRVTPDGANAEQVAKELATALATARQQHPSGGDEFMRTLPEEFTEAFTGVAFDPSLLKAQRGSAPFVRVLAALPDPYGKAVSGLVVRKTLGQVTKKRAEDAPRDSFTLQAEAFAMLAAMGLVANFDGALVSMERVLRKPENRAAALDTLCYVVQQSEAKLSGGAAKKETLALLLSSIDGLGDPRWAQETNFLRSKLQPLVQGAPAPAPAPAVPVPVPVPSTPAMSAPPQQQGVPMPVPVPVPVPVPIPAPAPPPAAASAPASTQLVTNKSVPLAAGSIFSLCYEPSKQQLVIGGKDTPLTVVGPGGEIVQQFQHPNQFVCAVDAFPQHHIALASLSSVPDTGVSTGIAVYNSNPWGIRSTINRPGTEMLACLRCLPGTNTFVTGESFKTATPEVFTEAVCMYDLGSALSSGVNAQPLRTWTEHTDLVSCLSPVPGSPHMFLSGSRDTTIKVWDTRMERSAGALQHTPPSPAAHHLMVSCIDAAAGEALVISSSLDGTVSAWDLRRMAGQPGAAAPVLTVQVDGQAVLKVALADTPYPRLAAVATVAGIYALDLQPSGQELVVTKVVQGTLASDVTSRQFNDIRWGRHQGQPVLFAACSDRPRVDVLSVLV